MDSSPDSAAPGVNPRYAELHCISNFTFLRGASQPEELVLRAAELGYGALAITDECTVAGVVKAYRGLAQLPSPTPLKLIVGTEIRITEGPHLVLLAANHNGYEKLCKLITRSRRRADKGSYQTHWDDLHLLTHGPTPGHAEAAERDASSRQPAARRTGPPDVLVLWLPDSVDRQAMDTEGQQLQALLGKDFWIALELFRQGRDLQHTAELLALSIRFNLPITAAGDVHMHRPERKALQDTLTAIRLGVPVADLGERLQPNAERHLRPVDDLLTLYPREMLEESLRITSHCHFSLDELRYEYPEEVVPPGMTATAWLAELTWKGAQRRWPEGVPDRVRHTVQRELKLIAELRYEHFFLTVHDIVAYARSCDILCQGRGSAANSAVCYCLHITEVDPARMNMLFERFLSKERKEPPDIDVDFEHERREEIIQYIYQRYGRHRTALAATLVTYRPRSAIRDVGKALGMDPALITNLSESLAWWDSRDALAERFCQAGLDPDSALIHQLLSLLQQLLGFPRHLSQHPGGFVIAQDSLSRLVPIENAAMDQRTIIQWDKDDLETLGLLKVDVLALGMLTAIRKSLDLIRQLRGRPIGLRDIPAEDPEVYAMLQQADSIGVFQIESRAQMSMLPRLKPRCFYDLVIQVAIVRPGPIQGDMVHPYLARRSGTESVTYSNDAVRKVLERTLGIPIFQEQVIALAMVAAGFTAGEADQLRRAMATWRRQGGLQSFRPKLVQGMLERGHDEVFAERIFKQIQGFGEYGFPESHAASFALLVYISAWLKRHEPAAFCCGLLNSLPMGFYSASQLVQDVQRHGIEVRNVDVQHSHWDHTLEPARQAPPGDPLLTYDYANQQPAIRLGLRQVKGFNSAAADRIVAARSRSIRSTSSTSSTSSPRSPRSPNTPGTPSIDVAALARTAALSKLELTALAEAGALQSLSGNRHQAHWDVLGIQPPPALWKTASQAAPDISLAGALPPATAAAFTTATAATASAIERSQVAEDVTLPTPEVAEELSADYRYLGLSLRTHPMRLLRGQGLYQRCARSVDLRHWRHGALVQVAGVVTGRQRPASAKGVIFVTLEDETGNINLVVWNSTLERFRPQVLTGQLLEVKGHCERDGIVVHVIAGHIADHSEQLAKLTRGIS